MEDFHVIGIGSSAGGMQALFEFFLHLKEEPDSAIILVPHLERSHQSFLAQIISKRTFLDTKIIEDGEMALPNKVLVMPQNKKVIIKEGRLHLIDRPPNEKINKAIDDFFISLANDQKDKAIGIILSGLGSDGSIGAIHIKEKGGMIMVQEPISAQFPSMPLNTITLDHPDYILPPRKMPQQLLEYLRNKIITFKEK